MEIWNHIRSLHKFYVTPGFVLGISLKSHGKLRYVTILKLKNISGRIVCCLTKEWGLKMV